MMDQKSREVDSIHVGIPPSKLTDFNEKSRKCLAQKKYPNSSPKGRRLRPHEASKREPKKS